MEMNNNFFLERKSNKMYNNSKKLIGLLIKIPGYKKYNRLDDF